MTKLAIDKAQDTILVEKLVQETGLPAEETADFLLKYSEQHLALQNMIDPRQKPLWIDFTAGKSAYRRENSGRLQDLAKAVGVKAQHRPRVLDTTAGLGRDAFVLACLGCDVLMLERSPVMGALLNDALQRFYTDQEASAEVSLHLKHIDALDYLQTLPETNYPDVIYIDPMFPERKKSALVKKDMRILRDIIGDDFDASDLLGVAISRATNRVVVKRHRLAPCLNQWSPSYQLTGKSTRFDVYLINDVAKKFKV